MAVALASIATRPQTVLPNEVPAREEVIQARPTTGSTKPNAWPTRSRATGLPVKGAQA